MSDPPSLAEVVIEFLAQQPGQAFTPRQIAEGVSARLDGRHVGVGAVITTCLHLAAQGRLVQASPAPKTFAHPVRAEDPSGQQ
ncbi:hypothetical protein [Catellatospora tritici]|uniref:hypothetical protein n=1 Tax=Catellatospora tritici TaxID=2851566 RepID=UPI001C2DCBC9|nr:hypothetical protein [Catellatospora tritici]MBV1854586.1 hypothetical protein [Catellatospora tritici]